MVRDVLFSFVLHLVLVAATVMTSPFDVGPRRQFDEVIRVSLTSLPSPAVQAPPEPVAIPTALNDDLPEIGLERPAVSKEAVIEPKPQPEPAKPEPKAPEQLTTQTDRQRENDQRTTAPASGPGSPFPGATIDNASFNYPYWFDQAFRKIATNYRNPVPYEGTLVCVVYFQVIRSGNVIELRIEQASGIAAFDQACLQAVERSTPFPPLPKQFRDEIIGITVPFKSGRR